MRVTAVASVLLGIGAPAMAAAQEAGTLAGAVRDEAGAGIRLARVIVGRRFADSDSAGRFRLDSVASGGAHVHVSRIGYRPLDTVIVVRAGAVARADVTMQRQDLFGDAPAMADSVAAVNRRTGAVDSIGAGLLRSPADSVRGIFDRFGGRLLQAVPGRDANVVLSPVSAGLAFGMATMGARGATASALATMLGLDGASPEAIRGAGARLLAATVNRTDVQLELANATWVDASARLTDGFARATESWGSRAVSLPLASIPARDAINEWARSVTHGRIARILDDRLPDSARVFLASAAYFKGKWLLPFDSTRTGPLAFTRLDGRRVTVRAMDMEHEVGYRRVPGYQVVRLPYRTGKTAMYVVLPDSGRFEAVAALVAREGWPRALRRRDERTVHVVLPRVHVEQAIELNDPAVALGAGVAFDCRRADFGDMAVLAPGDAGLCIGSASQRVYLDMNEEGTEAAAVTGVTMGTTTGVAVPVEIPQFIVDRPYLLLLRDELSGAPLFVGRIVQP